MEFKRNFGLGEHSRRAARLSCNSNYLRTKTLGLKWNVSTDQFRVSITDLPPKDHVTKRVIVSDSVRVFDVLEWYSPTIIKMKILLQRFWETKIDWDDPVPDDIHQVWLQWRNELPSLMTVPVSRCYSPVGVTIVSMQLHRFSDASEEAYAGVIYLCMGDSVRHIHTSLDRSRQNKGVSYQAFVNT